MSPFLPPNLRVQWLGEAITGNTGVERFALNLRSHDMQFAFVLIVR